MAGTFLVHVDFHFAKGDVLLDRQDGDWKLVYNGGNGSWTQGKLGRWKWDTSRDVCLLFDNRFQNGFAADVLGSNSAYISVGLFAFNPKAATFGFQGEAAWGPDGITRAARGTWEIVATPDQIDEVRQELTNLQAEIEATYRQVALDVLGCVDPTPISDCISAAQCIRAGEYVGATLSLISVVPYIGDLVGKSAKFARLVGKVRSTYARLRRVMNVLQMLEEKAARAKRMARETAARLEAARRKTMRQAAEAEERIRVAFRATIKRNFKKVADKAGWRMDDLANACEWCKNTVPPKLMVARSRNPIALRYEGKAGFRPKPLDINAMKSSKSGPHQGLFVRPTEADIADWARKEGKSVAEYTQKIDKEIADLRTKGWDFDSNGVLRDKSGNAVYSDIDYMGIYNVPEGRTATAWGGRLVDNDDLFFIDWINNFIHGKRQTKQHGNQDRFVKYSEQANLKAADDINFSPHRNPGADELTDPHAFLVIGPDGIPQTVSWQQLKEIYKRYGIPNPYQGL